MHLLFVTRKINPRDPRVGFMSSWISAFSKEAEELSILTWQTSLSHDMPQNAKLFSADTDKIGKIRGTWRFIRLAYACIREADGIFVHMMPIYVILTGPISWLRKKPILFWYTHKRIDLKLRIAVLLSTAIVTASRESFRLKTKKPMYIIGHGIDTEHFYPEGSERIWMDERAFHILSLGRISPVKQTEKLIDAVAILSKSREFSDITLKIVGDPALASDAGYLDELRKQVKDLGLENQVWFTGGVSHMNTRDHYRWAHIMVNLSRTGSIDKAVLEAMASGTVPLTSNEAFRTIIPKISYIQHVEPRFIAERIIGIIHMSAEARQEYIKNTRRIVVEGHNIRNFAKKVAHIVKRIKT